MNDFLTILINSSKIIINGIQLAQQKGAFTLEESAILYQEIKKYNDSLNGIKSSIDDLNKKE